MEGDGFSSGDMGRKLEYNIKIKSLMMVLNGKTGLSGEKAAYAIINLYFHFSYLEDAVMNLDHTDPVARDHMGSVLNQVRQKLYQFNQADPHNNVSKRARRLMMMLQGLVTPLS